MFKNSLDYNIDLEIIFFLIRSYSHLTFTMCVTIVALTNYKEQNKKRSEDDEEIAYIQIAIECK